MEDEDQKTEAASERRLKQAFDEGQVPVGRDFVGVAALSSGVAVLVSFGPTIRDRLLALIAASAGGVDAHSFGNLVPLGVSAALPFGAAIIAAAVAAIILTVAQTRGGFWPELVMPDFSRLAGGGRLKRLFTGEAATDMFLSAVKALAVGFALWSALKTDFFAIVRLLGGADAAPLAALFGPLARSATKVLGTMALLAGVDLALAHLRFRKKVRMSREETKREHKEDEGDPLVKSRRKRRHRDLLKGLAIVEVPKADALIVNPTHVAIAIRYRKDEGRAPKVTAKGKGELADHMRELARSNGIPIVQDIPLARALHKRVKIGREVPADLFKGVAAVLAFVYRVTGKMPGGAAPQKARG